MYLRGLKNYPYKRRRVYPGNRTPSSLDEIIERRSPNCKSDSIPCSKIQGRYYRPQTLAPISKCLLDCTSESIPCHDIPEIERPIPMAAAGEDVTAGLQISAICKIRIPRPFLVGFEQDQLDRRSRSHIDIGENIPEPDSKMEVPLETEKEKEWVLTKDSISEYYFYEDLPDPLAAPEVPVLPMQVVTFDSRDLGSFPPKHRGMLLFREVERRRLDECTLDCLEEVDDKTEKEQPERENAPNRKSQPEPVRPVRHLPLKNFDNPSLELHHPAASLKKAVEGGKPGRRARSKWYSSYRNASGQRTHCVSWKPCLVLSYDWMADLYAIVWLAENGSQMISGKLVSRLNLIFDEENEASFILRRLHALDLRDRVEADLRQFYFIENLRFHNSEKFEGPIMEKIMFVAGGRLCLKYPMIVEGCMAECRLDFCRSIKYSIVEHEFLINEEVREKLIALKLNCQARKLKPPLSR